MPVRVHVVDPSAYTPPYDHALCTSLAAAGARVELYTSRFAYAPVAAPAGYVRREFFYRRAAGCERAATRRVAKLTEHVPDMLRYRRAARAAEIVHFQWLPVQQLDAMLLPPSRASTAAKPALVLTAHDVVPHDPRFGQLGGQRRLYGHFDAIIVHTGAGRDRLVHELGAPPGRVHVIAHGALGHLAEGEEHAPKLQAHVPVVLFFGLLRPYKGIEQLLSAWHGIEGAELWIVGMPRVDISGLRAAAPAGVRFDARFVSDAELRGYLRRADLIVAPYLEAEQSGVALTALAFGKPLLVSDVGGLAELAQEGAARAVPAGDVGALRGALRELVADRAQRDALARRALVLARERYAWPLVAQQTLALYRDLLGDNGAR